MAGDGWPGMAPLAGIDSGPWVEVGNADSWLLAYMREKHLAGMILEHSVVSYQKCLPGEPGPSIWLWKKTMHSFDFQHCIMALNNACLLSLALLIMGTVVFTYQ